MSGDADLGTAGSVSAVLAALDQPVLVCRPDGLVQECNAAASALTDQLWDGRPWEGHRLDQRFDDHDRIRVAECHVAAAMGRAMQCEVVTTDRQGIRRSLSLRWRPIAPTPGRITGVCVSIMDLTPRYTAEQTLGVLRRALDAIAEGVMVADLEQRPIFYNRAFERLSGGNAGGEVSLRGMLTGAEDRAKAQEQLQRAQPWAGEIQGAGADGQAYWHEVAVMPLFNDAAEVTHYVGVRGDITGRKQMERSLEESRSRLQAVITTAMDGIVSFDEAQRIVLINRAAAAMFQLSESDALGREIAELIPVTAEAGAGSAVNWRELMTGAATAASGRLGELEAVRSNGEVFPVEVTVSHVQVHGRQIHTIILRDISARREAERVLQASQHRFRSIFEFSLDGIVLTDDSGRLIDANPAACALLGCSREEAVSHRLHDLALVADEQSFDAMWTAFLRTGSARGELTLRRQDDRTALVEYSAIANILKGLHLSIMRDVTERRRLQDQLLRQQRLDSVGRLASGLAHDLNNILTPILMVPGMLRGRTQDAVSLNLLDLLEQGARRGAAIIEQLLTFAREMPGERKIQHLGALAEAAARIIRETFPKNIDLDLRVEGQPRPFVGDATQVQQLILNLALNAKDSMLHGGRLTITVANETITPEVARATPGAKAGPHVSVSVIDTGHGIAPEHMERIFDPFFSTKGVGEGTGLGLSAALGIARNHGGFITVRSQLRVGSTFRVCLPAVGGGNEATTNEGAAGAAEASGVVLVVDDEEHLRLITRQLLVQHGYTVICARDGETALTHFKSSDHRIDLVLTDLAMPGMGGERLIRSLRRQDPQLPIVVMTGHDPADTIQTGRVRVDGVVRKPFSGAELLQALAVARRGGAEAE